MTASSLAAGRFRRLPQRASEVWQGGPVRLPMWIDSPAGPPPARHVPRAMRDVPEGEANLTFEPWNRARGR